MKIVLLASVLFLACSNVWAAIGSGVVIQPDPNGNTGPFPPHMQWQGSAANLPPLPAGSTIYVQTGGNYPPVTYVPGLPFFDLFGTTPLPPQPPVMQPVPEHLYPVDPTAPNL
jgi:hypothetical protein